MTPETHPALRWATYPKRKRFGTAPTQAAFRAFGWIFCNARIFSKGAMELLGPSGMVVRSKWNEKERYVPERALGAMQAMHRNGAPPGIVIRCLRAGPDDPETQRWLALEALAETGAEHA